MGTICHNRNCRVPAPRGTFLCAACWHSVPFEVQMELARETTLGQCWERRRVSRAWVAVARKMIRIATESRVITTEG